MNVPVAAERAAVERNESTSLAENPAEKKGAEWLEHSVPPPATSVQPLEALSPNVYADVLQNFDEEITMAMLQKLLETDPATALDYMQKNMEGMFYAQLLTSWTQQDPVNGYRWIKENELNMDSASYDALELSTLLAMSKSHPADALQYIDTITNDEDRGMLLAEIAGDYTRENPAAAFDWLEQLSMDESVSHADLTRGYQKAIAAYSESNPAQAAALVQALDSPKLQEQLAGSVAASLAAQNMEQAIAWLGGLPLAESKYAGWYGLLENANEADQQLLVKRFLNDPNLLQSDSSHLNQILYRCAEVNLPLAVEQFNSIPDAAKEEAAEVVINKWADQERGAEAAGEWISHNLEGAAYDRGAKLLAEEYMHTRSNPEQAFLWLNSIESQEVRTGLIKQFIHSAKPDDLSYIDATLQNIELSAEDRANVDQLLDERIKNDFSNLILP